MTRTADTRGATGARTHGPTPQGRPNQDTGWTPGSVDHDRPSTGKPRKEVTHP